MVTIFYQKCLVGSIKSQRAGARVCELRPLVYASPDLVRSETYICRVIEGDPDGIAELVAPRYLPLEPLSHEARDAELTTQLVILGSKDPLPRIQLILQLYLRDPPVQDHVLHRVTGPGPGELSDDDVRVRNRSRDHG